MAYESVDDEIRRKAVRYGISRSDVQRQYVKAQFDVSASRGDEPKDVSTKTLHA